MSSSPKNDTPIELKAGILLKRDDLFEIGGIRGGKVRACYHIATGCGAGTTPRGLVTASARKSPQMQIVARMARRLGVPAHLHTATGTHTAEMVDAEANGGTLVQHKPGYNSVIIHRAEEDALATGYVYIPFGMEHPGAIDCTRAQVKTLAPYRKQIKRIVICLGSGMTACGLLWGLQDLGWHPRGTGGILDPIGGDGYVPVIGVRIGSDPIPRLNSHAPLGWQRQLKIFTSRHGYTTAVDARVGGVLLDPHYEAKCAEFLKPGDLFWIVGIRAGLED